MTIISPDSAARTATTIDGTSGAWEAFEMGLAQEVHTVYRLNLNGTTKKASPIALGPISFDVDATNGGTVKVYQADTLQALVTGKFRLESWSFNAGQRVIKGLVPVRRFVVVMVNGPGLLVEPRPLGTLQRGPSSMKLAAETVNWTV